MKITILKVAKVNGESYISFQSGPGLGVGKWMNEENPVVNYSYDVELDTDKTVSEARKNISQQKPRHSLRIEGDKVLLFGVLESIESDGMAYLRLSSDCLIMIETGQESFSEGESLFLEFERSDLEITAQGL